MTPSPLKALVFDFDGTLAVPALDFALMRQRAAAAVAPFLAGRDILLHTGLPVLEELARIRALLPPELAEAVNTAAFAAIEAVEVEAASRSSLFPFVRPMLAVLAERGLLFGIITRNCPAAVFTVFPDARDFTACILTRDDVPNVKPHPGHLERALALLRVRPEECVTAGDHPMDIQLGKAVGAQTAGIASGGSSLARLARERPDYLAADGADLLRQLEILP